MCNYTETHLHECQRIFVKNYLCTMRIGVHPHEQKYPQKIQINVTIYLPRQYTSPETDSLTEVYNYSTLICILKQESQKNGIKLQETLCQNIAKNILQDKRISAVAVSSEKLSVYKECTSIGVQTLTFQSSST